MISVRKAVIVGHAVILVAAAALYVSNHGGVAGDYVFRGTGNDVIADPADVGQVVLNRWSLEPSDEPWPVQLFLYLNLPSFAAAKFAMFGLGLLSNEMNRTFPLGLSYSSYIAGLGLMLSFVQWYWIGRLGEILVNRFHHRPVPYAARRR